MKGKMKSLRFLALIVLGLALIVGALSACTPDENTIIPFDPTIDDPTTQDSTFRITVVDGKEVDFYQMEQGAVMTVVASEADDKMFLYWEYQGRKVTEEATYSFAVTEDANLNAVFCTAYTIYLDAEGGSVSVESVKVGVGQNYELPVPERQHYVFVGWFDHNRQYTDEKGKGIAPYTNESDVTLTAVYSEKPIYDVNITYYFETPGMSHDPEKFSFHEDEEAVLEAEDLTDAMFLGWYDEKDNRLTEEREYRFTVTEEVNLTVKYRRAYTVRVVGGSGTGIYSEETDIVIRLSTVPTGRYFVGWRLQGSNELLQAAAPEGGGNDLNYHVSGSAVIEAVYEWYDYYITYELLNPKNSDKYEHFDYHAPGDTVGVEKQGPLHYGDPIILQTYIPEAGAHQVFSGWDLKLGTMPDHDLTVRGSLATERFEMTLTRGRLYLNGRETSERSLEYEQIINFVGSAAEAAEKGGYCFVPETRTQEGYKFLNISVTSRNETNTYSSGESVTVEANMRITATYEQINYKVVWQYTYTKMGDDGEPQTGATERLTSDQILEIVPDGFRNFDPNGAFHVGDTIPSLRYSAFTVSYHQPSGDGWQYSAETDGSGSGTRRLRHVDRGESYSEDFDSPDYRYTLFATIAYSPRTYSVSVNSNSSEAMEFKWNIGSGGTAGGDSTAMYVTYGSRVTVSVRFKAYFSVTSWSPTVGWGTAYDGTSGEVEVSASVSDRIETRNYSFIFSERIIRLDNNNSDSAHRFDFILNQDIFRLTYHLKLRYPATLTGTYSNLYTPVEDSIADGGYTEYELVWNTNYNTSLDSMNTRRFNMGTPDVPHCDFAGWYYNLNAEGEPKELAKLPSSFVGNGKEDKGIVGELRDLDIYGEYVYQTHVVTVASTGGDEENYDDDKFDGYIRAEDGSELTEITVEYGTELTVVATEPLGYSFVNWNLNGEPTSEDNEFTFTVGDENILLDAVFERDMYNAYFYVCLDSRAEPDDQNYEEVDGVRTYKGFINAWEAGVWDIDVRLDIYKVAFGIGGAVNMATIPTRNGYTFRDDNGDGADNWYYFDDDGQKQTAQRIGKVDSEDHLRDLYYFGVYVPKEFSFGIEGGHIAGIRDDFNSQTFDGEDTKNITIYFDSIVSVKADVEEGYDFDSWTLDDVRTDDASKRPGSYLPAGGAGEAEYDFVLSDWIFAGNFDPETLLLTAVTKETNYVVRVTNGKVAKLNGDTYNESELSAVIGYVLTLQANEQDGKYFIRWQLNGTDLEEGVNEYTIEGNPPKSDGEDTRVFEFTAIYGDYDYIVRYYAVDVEEGEELYATDNNEGRMYKFGDPVELKAKKEIKHQVTNGWVYYDGGMGVNTGDFRIDTHHRDSETDEESRIRYIDLKAVYEYKSYTVKVTGGLIHSVKGWSDSAEIQYNSEVRVVPGSAIYAGDYVGKKFANWTNWNGVIDNGDSEDSYSYTFKLEDYTVSRDYYVLGTEERDLPDEVVVTANYDYIDYTLEYRVKGGKYGEEDQVLKSMTVHYGDVIDLGDPDDQVGYVFTGWRHDEHWIDISPSNPYKMPDWDEKSAQNIPFVIYGGYVVAFVYTENDREGMDVAANDEIVHDEIKVSDYYKSKLEIPTTTPDGKTVNGIREKGFINLTVFTEIVIPDGIAVGNGAFTGCASVETVTLGILGEGGLSAIFGEHVPATLDHVIFTGTEIPENAFLGLNNIGVIDFENAINIGAHAFEGTGISSVTIGKDVKTIGSRAFANTSLDEVIYNAESANEGVDVENIFAATDGFTDVTIGADVRKLPSYLFRLVGEGGTTSLRINSLTFERGIEEIGNYAFAEQGQGSIVLTELNLPEGVTTIGEYAFYNMPTLNTLTIPSTVTKIGQHAFAELLAITQFTYDAANIEAGNFGENAFDRMGGSALTDTEVTLTIGADVEKIPTVYPGMFSATSAITVTKLVFAGSKLESVGDNAFQGLRMTDIDLSGETALRRIGSGAFGYTSSVKSIVLPDNLAEIGSNAFVAESLYAESFELVLGDNVTTIGEAAFRGRTNVTKLTLGSAVKTIGNSAFYGMTGLTEIVYRAKAADDLYVGDSIFAFSGSESDINGSAADIKLTVENTVSSIPAYAFVNAAINEIVFAEGFAGYSVGAYAFYNIRAKEISLPYCLTTIGERAFGVPSGEGFTISTPRSGDARGWAAEWNFNRAVTYRVGSKSYDGYVYYVENDKAYLIEYTYSQGEVTVPAELPADPSDPTQNLSPVVDIGTAFVGINSIATIDLTGTEVTEIPNGAFENCTGLETVTANNITYVGERAFAGCSSLTTLNIGSSVTEVGASAFDGTQLGAFDFASAVKIGARAFYGVALSGSVDLSNVEIIGSEAFRNAANITDITLGDNLAEVGESAFRGMSALTKFIGAASGKYFVYNGALYSEIDGIVTVLTYPVAGEVLDLYGNIDAIAPYAFENSKLITFASDDVTTIGEGAFYNCAALVEVTIGTKVAFIGKSAFRGCKMLATINYNTLVEEVKTEADDEGHYPFFAESAERTLNVGEGVKSIPDRLFEDAKVTIFDLNGLEEIGESAFEETEETEVAELTLPESLLRIGENAFKGYKVAELNYNVAGRLARDTGRVTAEFDPGHEDFGRVTNVVIGENVTNLPDYIFARNVDSESGVPTDYIGITGLTIIRSETPFGVGNYAFADSEVTKVVLKDPDGGNVSDEEGVFNLARVSNIGSYAFRNMTFDKLVLPATLTLGIGVRAFSGNAELKEVEVGFDELEYLLSDGVFYESGVSQNVKVSFVGNKAPGGSNVGLFTVAEADKRIHVTEVTFADSVTEIGDNLLKGQATVTEITLPSALTRIGISAFENTGISTVEIKNNVNYIGNRAFYGTKLTSVTYSAADVADFEQGNDIFAVSDTEEALTVRFVGTFGRIPAYFAESVNGTIDLSEFAASDDSAIGAHAFENATFVENSLTLSGNISSIGDYAFYNTEISDFNLTGSGATEIGAYAFSRCYKLSKFTAEAGTISAIGNHAFDKWTPGAGEEDSPVPEFTSLSEFTVGDVTATAIGEYAFYRNSELAAVPLGSVVTFGEGAFKSTGLTAADLTSAESIGKEAFRYAALSEVTLPENLATIGDLAFANLKNLTAINFESANAQPPTDDNTIGIFASSGAEEGVTLTVGEKVTTIGQYMFGLLKTNIADPESSDPETGAPLNFTVPNITTLNFSEYPESALRSIGIGAFRYAPIRSIDIPDYVETIGKEAFAFNDAATDVTIGSGVTGIGRGAFNGLVNVQNLNYNTDKPTFDAPDPAFLNFGRKDDSAEGKSVTLTFGENVTQVNEFMFASNAGIDLVVVRYSGDGAFTFGSNCFKGLSQLVDVEIVNKVNVAVSASAFDGCVSFGQGAHYEEFMNCIISIGTEAFARTGITEVIIGGRIGWGEGTAVGNRAFADVYSEEGITLRIQLEPKTEFDIEPQAAFATGALDGIGYKTVDGVRTKCDVSASINYFPAGVFNAELPKFATIEFLMYTVGDTSHGARIGDNAFAAYKNSDDPVTVTGVVSYVGESAFDGLASWTIDVDCTDGVIGNRAFAGSGITRFDFYVYGKEKECRYTNELSVGDEAFKDSSLKTIGTLVYFANADSSFESGSNFSTFTKVGNSAFENCDGLTFENYTLVGEPEGTVFYPTMANPYVLSIGDRAFANTGITAINLGSSDHSREITYIGDNAFEGSVITTWLTYYSPMEDSEDPEFRTVAFWEFTALTHIGANAFKDTTLGISFGPEVAVEYIGESAFENANIHSFTFRPLEDKTKTVTVGSNAFAGTTVSISGLVSEGDGMYYVGSEEGNPVTLGENWDGGNFGA